MNLDKELESINSEDICDKLENLELSIGSLEGVMYDIVKELKPIAHANSQNLIPDGITYIGDYAFAKDGPDDYGSIKYFIIPKSVKHIGIKAFANKGTDSIEVDPDNEHYSSIDGVLFSKPDQRLVSYPTGWTETSYVIPEGTRIIGDYAFGNCKTLTDIDIPESVVSIGNGAFASCESLSSVSIPDGITRIGDDTFSLCVRMTDIAMPDSITYIGSFAFYNCISLSAVTIPENVTYIGEYAFVDCSLKTVTIPDSVISIGKDAFHRLPEAYVMDVLIKLNGSASVFLPSLVVGHGSYAEQYCIDNHLKYTFADGST